MSDFIFKVSPHIVLGTHTVARIGQMISVWGDKFIVLSDPVMKEYNITEKIVKSLEEQNIDCFVFDEIPSAPTGTILEQVLTLSRNAYIDGVISVGGIKTSSLGRALAAIYNEKFTVMDYIDGAAVTSNPIPFIDVISTLRDPFMFADRVPIIDPRNNQIKILKTQNSICKMLLMDSNLFVLLSKNQMNSMLLQSLCLAIEAYISTKANFFSDTIVEKAIQLFTQTTDEDTVFVTSESKEIMAAQTGLMSCLAVGASSPGIITSIAFAINARYKVSRALVSSILLPYMLEDSLRARVAQLAKISKIMNIAQDNVSEVESAESLIVNMRNRLAITKLPTRLKDLGLTIEQLAPIADDAARLEIMNFLPYSMTADDIFDLMKKAY